MSQKHRWYRVRIVLVSLTLLIAKEFKDYFEKWLNSKPDNEDDYTEKII